MLTYTTASLSSLKPRTNGRNVVGQQLPTLLDVTCYVRLHTLLHVVACYWEFLRKVWNRLKFWANNSPTFLLFSVSRGVAQQCWICLHSFSNIVGATHAHYTWSPKCNGLYPFHDALQIPTMLDRQCWELLRPCRQWRENGCNNS